MNASLYERLMRKAFSCERKTTIGADAQIYESMEYFSKQLANHE